ncbi:hypothetical protein Taro_054303, partial [Colocasia esculenta]|nr:hypothetical protein [Colocasia esculenta]
DHDHVLAEAAADATATTRTVPSATADIAPAGVEDWAQSTHWFTVYECDCDERRVMNATALGVAFLKPLFGGRRLHARRVSRVGRLTDIGLGKATTSYIVFRRFGVLEQFFSHCEDVAWSGGDAVPWLVCVFFAKTYWSPASPVFPVPHFRELVPESLRVPGMGLQLGGLQVWCWLVSTVLWLVLVERQLDLSSVTARLRGGTVVLRLYGGVERELGFVEVVWGYRLYGLQRHCDRLVPPAIALVVLCELVLPRGMPQIVRFHGLEDWAQSTHWFTVCKRDSAEHHVLNVKALGATVLKSLFGGHRLHARRVSRVGRLADVNLGKATTSYVAFSSQWRATSRSQLRCAFMQGRPNRAQQALLSQGDVSV